MKPIKMLPALGSLTSPLCVKVILGFNSCSSLKCVQQHTKSFSTGEADRWGSSCCFSLDALFSHWLTGWKGSMNKWINEWTKKTKNLFPSPSGRRTPGHEETWWARRPWWHRCGLWIRSPRCTPLWVCCWSLEQTQTTRSVLAVYEGVVEQKVQY